MDRARIINYCRKAIELSIYVVIISIPISKALIESFLGLMIFAWLISKIAQKAKLNEIFCPTYLNIPILLYMSVCIISVFLSTNPDISLKHLISKTAEYILFFFIVVETLDKRILKNALIITVFSAGIIGIDGIFQYFSKWDFIRHRTPVIPFRINASFNTPNDFASYIATILPLVASISFFKVKKPWKKAAVIIVAAILFICLILSASRSVWFAILLAIPFALLLRNKKLATFILLLIIISLIFSPLLSDISRDRIKNFFNFSGGNSDRHRGFLWQISFNMFKERPLLGQGLGTFMYNFQRFQPDEYPYNWGICYAHNCFLQIAAETGIMGLLTFVWILALLFFVSYRNIRRIKDTYFYNTLSGLLIGLFAYLINSFFDTNLYSLPLTVLFWFVVALIVSINKIIKGEGLV